MAVHAPLILTDPSIKISKTNLTTGLTELACDASHVELSPDTEVTTVDTFCGSTDYPGTTKWSLIMTLIQSFDTDATEAVLSAALASGGSVPFELIGYKTPPISATNPKWTGMVRPAPYSPINGDAGDASTIDLEWAVTQGPVKGITPTAFLAAELEEMTLDDLRSLADSQSLPTTGTKAELVKRLGGPETPTEAA